MSAAGDALHGEGLAIHLDLVGGLAGDMFVAALVDALPALEPPVLAAVEALRPADSARPAFTTHDSAGLRARRFGLATGYRHATRRPAMPPGQDTAHGTSSAAIRARIAAAPLPPATRDHALALLTLLAEAEAGVHGVAPDAVHFHELADWDSLMDLAAAGCIAAELAGARWSASAPPLGNGQVRTAHGLLPVPTPATAALLTGYAWHDDGVGGERVTPTGAAILRHLVPPPRCGGARAAGRLVGVGTGAGTRALPGLPNVTRALVFATSAPLPLDEAETDSVAVLEFDIDDMTGEEIALAAERLRALAGVLDVSLANRSGKKGRPVTEMRLLSAPAAATAVAQACFRETSTLGLRLREERRQILRRSDVRLQLDERAVTVKLAQRPDGETSGKAAHDDTADGASLAARRQRRERAVAAALSGDASPPPPPEER
ncbi:MAG: LarC family nickel insertion protein [Burkholderiales bacterium]|nr:LarC family nickel insertion protein [Burkholderiales bacterium]